MSVTTYITRDGDTIDWIAWKHYGTQPGDGVLEQLVAANYGVADYGPILPAGVTIALPEITPKPPQSKGLKLWD